MFFMHVFIKFFYKSKKNMFFMFFICKSMFLTSMLDCRRPGGVGLQWASCDWEEWNVVIVCCCVDWTLGAVVYENVQYDCWMTPSAAAPAAAAAAAAQLTRHFCLHHRNHWRIKHSRVALLVVIATALLLLLLHLLALHVASSVDYIRPYVAVFNSRWHQSILELRCSVIFANLSLW